MLPRGIARKIVLGYVLPLIVLLVVGLLVPVLLWGFGGRYRREYAAHKELASRVDVLLHAAQDIAEAEQNLQRFHDSEFRFVQNQARGIYQERSQEVMAWFEDHSRPELKREFQQVNAAFQNWDRNGNRKQAGFAPIKEGLRRLNNQAVQERDRYEPLYLLADTLRNMALVVFPLGALAGALSVGRSIARTITEPLESLARAVEELEHGGKPDGSVEPDWVRNDDELSELWRALHRMAGAVQERERALETRSEALATAGRRLESVLNATNDGIALLSPEGRFLLVNPRFAAFFGQEPSDILEHPFMRAGLRLLTLFKQSDQAAARQRLREVLLDNELVAEETFSLARPFPRVLRFFTSPVRSEGALIGRIVVLRDVTRETEADRLKSEFASTVSHELRTPLTAIHGNVALLLSEKPGALTDDQREFLSLTQTNVQRLTELITDMLDLSRLESAGLELHLEPLACGPIARQVIRTMEEQARARGLSLSLVAPESLPPVRGDQDRIAQVLMNLISNALKYTPTGGKIVVRLEVEERFVAVRVSDTGIGLTPEDRARLFNKFFRADNSTTRSVGGTGLGLAISKAIVERLGGTIRVESTPGVGSTFVFTLPLAETATEPVAPSPVSPVASPRRLLLLVHDQTAVLHKLNHALSHQGMIVSAAAMPSEALRRARDLRPDALLLSPFTVAFDAFQLLRELRAEPTTERVNVLLYGLRAVELYELRDNLALTSPERLPAALTQCVTDPAARNRPVVVVGEEAFFRSIRELWPRQSLSPLVWCAGSEELTSRVGPLCPLLVLCETATQDMRAVGSFARLSLERHSNQRTVWLFVGEFGARSRVLVPHGSGAIALDQLAPTLQEAITAAL